MSGHLMPKDVQISLDMSNFGVQALFLNPNLISTKIAPVVSVDKITGDWYKKTPREGVQIQHEDVIEDGGPSTEVNFKYEQDSYSTQEHGRHHKLSDRTRQNKDQVLPEEELSGMTDIMHGMATSREYQTSAIVLTQANYPAGHWFAASAAWDLPTTNPKHDVNRALRIIELASGYRANKIVMPPQVYDTFIENEYLADFIRYQGGIAFLETGELPNQRVYGLELVRAGAVYDESAPLVNMNLGYIWERLGTDGGADWCWVGYVDPIPSIKTGGFMNTFVVNPRIKTDQDLGTASQWYDNKEKSTYFEFRSDYGIKATNHKAAAVITAMMTALTTGGTT